AMPGVTWRSRQWELRVTAFATGSRRQSRLVARYELKNLTTQTLPLELILAARPFQVNPPEQSLNIVGGVSPIRHVTWDGTSLAVNPEPKIFPLRQPGQVGAPPFAAGPVVSRLRSGDWAGRAEIHDDTGYASAVLGYRVMLAPHATATVGIVVPLSGSAREPDLGDASPASWIAR